MVSGISTNAGCVREATSAIQQWFVAMSVGDTALLRRLAKPALLVFSFGRNGLPEPFFRADRVDDLIPYVARRHRARERLSLLEIRFTVDKGSTIGFMPIFRRTADDSVSTKGLWLGKAEYKCGAGVFVMNLAPWPENVPPYVPLR
jgi:hypothetical protein